LGFNQVYLDSKRSLIPTSLSLFIVAMGFISCSTVLNIRERRSRFNTIVLQESNQKLSALIWLLNCSIKVIDSIGDPDDLVESEQMRRTRDGGFGEKEEDLEQGVRGYVGDDIQGEKGNFVGNDLGRNGDPRN
jgi:hypothetical protein